MSVGGGVVISPDSSVGDECSFRGEDEDGKMGQRDGGIDLQERWNGWEKGDESWMMRRGEEKRRRGWSAGEGK